MKSPAILAAALVGFLGVTSVQAAPAVVASIKPIHSLVAAVMQGVGEPTLLVKGGASPHTYAMRPSDATALDEADVVFWVGESLETFLTDPLDTLTEDARVVELMEAEGVATLANREGGVLEGEAHDAHEEGGEEGGERHDHGHAREDDHDHEHEHAEAQADREGHGHDHGATDPHIWLGPGNAAAILDAVAETLSDADPENAARYSENAARARQMLASLDAEIDAQLAPVEDVPFIVFHDAYQYFQRHYGLNMVGSITLSPDRAPGAARIAEIREEIAETGAACVFAEPQFEPRIVGVVTEGTEARQANVDPVGADLADGPDLYPRLLKEMANSFSECLSAGR